MTGMNIYFQAMDLCGMRLPTSEIPDDCADMRFRSANLLNLLMAENAVLESYIKGSEPSVLSISSLEDNIEMSDFMCSLILPYGLAYLLTVTEDTGEAAFFKNRYETLREQVRNDLPGVVKDIKEVY